MRTHFLFESTSLAAAFISLVALTCLVRHRGRDRDADARAYFDGLQSAESVRTRDPYALRKHPVYDILVAPSPRSRYRTPIAHAKHGSFCTAPSESQVNDCLPERMKIWTIGEAAPCEIIVKLVIASTHLSRAQIAHTLSCQWRVLRMEGWKACFEGC